MHLNSRRLQFFTNVGWMTVSVVLTASSGALISLLLARKLGPSRFGEWSLLVASVSWVLGLRSAMHSDLIRKCAQQRDQARTLLVPAWLLIVTVGGALGLAGALTTFAVRSGATWVATIFMLTTTIVAAMLAMILAVFLSRDQMFWGVVDGVQGVLVLIAITALPAAAADTVSLAAVYCVAAFVCAAPVAAYGLWTIKPTLQSNLFQRIRRLAADNAWLAGVNLCALLHLSIDLYILQAFRGSLEVGVYTSALKLIVLVRMIPWLVAMSALPELSRRFAAGDTAFARRFWCKVTDWVVPFQGLIALVMVAAPTLIVKLLYSNRYENAAPALTVLSVSVTPHCLWQTLSLIVMAAGKYREHCYISIGGTLAHVVASLLLVPALGSVGAGVAFCLGESLGAIGLGILAWQILGPFRLAGVGATLVCLGFSVCFRGVAGRLNWTPVLSNTAMLMVYTSLSIVCYRVSARYYAGDALRMEG